MTTASIISNLENLVFNRRRWVIWIFAVVTVFMAYSATKLGIDASFSKNLPLKHEYMQTFIKHG